MPLIPLNTVNADASQRETKKSKLIDIIIENTNLGIDENLYEPSRGIAIADSFPVLNSLVGIPSICMYEEFTLLSIF